MLSAAVALLRQGIVRGVREEIPISMAQVSVQLHALPKEGMVVMGMPETRAGLLHLG